MRPPELHVPLELHRRVAQGVEEIEQAAVLLVPALGVRPADDVDGQVGELGVVLPLRPVLQEPARLDGVARVQLAALGQLGAERTIRPHELVDPLFRGLHVPQESLLALLELPLVGGGLAVGELLDEIHENHRHGERLERRLTGIGRPADLLPVERPLPDQREHPPRFLQVAFVAAGPPVFRHRHDVEAFAEDLPLHVDGRAVGRHPEWDPVVGREGLEAEKLGAAAGHRQPLGFLLHGAVELAEQPGLAALQPAVLGDVEHLAGAVEAVPEAAVLAIPGVPLPEWNHAAEQLVLELGAEAAEGLCRHRKPIRGGVCTASMLRHVERSSPRHHSW